MEFFSHRAGVLSCEEVGLPEIAERYGTPAYVYSATSILDRFQALEDAYSSVPHLICYALKANDNLAIARLLADRGAGVDVVSGGEAFRALRAGFPASRMIFAGVGKTDREIREALDAQIMAFNVESSAELAAIERAASDMGRVARISIRVNPNVDPQTHPYISTGLKKSKFGVEASKVVELYRTARDSRNLEPIGIQMHIGSQLVHVQPIVDAVDRLADLVFVLRRNGIDVQYVDIGGGIGIRYHDEDPEGPGDLALHILPTIRDLNVKLVCEPGRFIVGNSGVLLTRVLYRKENGGKKFVIVDAAMNDLLRPSLYSAYHDIRPVCVNNAAVADHEIVDVVGPVCESGDFLAHDRPLAPSKAGDLFAVMSAGAYGFAMSSNYNARGRAAEVLVTGASARLVRRREEYEDLVRMEDGL